MENNNMENDNASTLSGSIQATLAEAERLSTAAWTDADDMPPWMYPAAGLWFASTLVCVRFVVSNGWFLIPLFALLVLEGVAIAWLSRRNSVRPDLRRMPREFRIPVIGYLVGVAVVIAATILILEVSIVAGFVFCAAASTAGMVVYRTHWYRAVAGTRARVGHS